jgi:hypothetical protein
MSLIARLRNASRGQLWAALLLLLAANFALAFLVVVYMPVKRLYPYCNPPSYDISYEFHGEMAWPFFNEYHDFVGSRPHMVWGTRIYVTLWSWWADSDWWMNMSHKATARLLAQRTRRSESDVHRQLVGIAEFDEADWRWPPCGAMHKLALEGGEWANQGPPLKPGVGRGQIVPLPHLTDPLLFEPVRPREPEAADGKSDAGPR